VSDFTICTHAEMEQIWGRYVNRPKGGVADGIENTIKRLMQMLG
jgi:hypothetical protein